MADACSLSIFSSRRWKGRLPMHEKIVSDVYSGKEISKMKTDYQQILYFNTSLLLLVSWILSCSGTCR